MKRPRTLTAAGLALAACLLAGCAPATSSSAITIEQVLDEARAANDDAAVGVLSDLVVTRAEVDAAYERMLQCFTTAGVTVVSSGVSPIDGWRREPEIHFADHADEEASNASNSCWFQDYFFVAQGYSLMDEDRIDTALLPEILTCARNKGISVPDGARSLRDLLPLGSLDPKYIAVSTCAEGVASEHGYTEARAYIT